MNRLLNCWIKAAPGGGFAIRICTRESPCSSGVPCARICSQTAIGSSSVSIASVEFEAIADGTATRLVFTEQGAYFEGGEAANAEREEGTIGLLKQLEASL